MENKFQVFNNAQFGNIHVTVINRIVYFDGKDAVAALGFINATEAIADFVEEEDIKLVNSADSTTLFISECGLYSLIKYSNHPDAKIFKYWISNEVIPVALNNSESAEIQESPINPQFIVQLKETLKAEQEKAAALAIENAMLIQQLAELKPKATYFDIATNGKLLVSIETIANDYEMTVPQFKSMLLDFGVLEKQSGVWLLSPKYAFLGWIKSKVHRHDSQPKLLINWTQKGRYGIYEVLKSKGVLPKIEKTLDDLDDEICSEQFISGCNSQHE